MKTEVELCTKNNETSSQIQDIHPELSQFLEVMQITFPNKSTHDYYMKSICEYFESLKIILEQNS